MSVSTCFNYAIPKEDRWRSFGVSGSVASAATTQREGVPQWERSMLYLTI